MEVLSGVTSILSAMLLLFSLYLIYTDLWTLATIIFFTIFSTSVGRFVVGAITLHRRCYSPYSGTYGTLRDLVSQHGALLVALSLVAICIQTALHPDSMRCLLNVWHVALSALLLPAVFMFDWPTKAALSAELRSSRSPCYGHGAAWLYFLGYLELCFGDDGTTFETRMHEYMVDNGISEDGEHWLNFSERLVLLLPQSGRCRLSESDLQRNDGALRRERALRHGRDISGRQYGQTHVYTCRDPRHQSTLQYRFSVEVASPLRTMMLTLQDADNSFTDHDYDQFCQLFTRSLRLILSHQTVVGSQLELVSIARTDRIAISVVDRIKYTSHKCLTM